MDRREAERIVDGIKERPFVEGEDFRWEERDGRRVCVMLRYPDPPTPDEIEALRVLGLSEPE